MRTPHTPASSTGRLKFRFTASKLTPKPLTSSSSSSWPCLARQSCNILPDIKLHIESLPFFEFRNAARADFSACSDTTPLKKRWHMKESTMKMSCWFASC